MTSAVLHFSPRATTINNHPAAVAARDAANLLKDQRLKQQALIERAKTVEKIRFLHVGVHTIAYRVDRRNVIEISTSIRRPDDNVDNHVGKYEALKRFAGNNRIHLRIPGGDGQLTPKQFLTFLFSVATD